MPALSSVRMLVVPTAMTRRLRPWPCDLGSRFGRDAVEFAVHLVVFDVFFFDRPERPQADVESDEDFFHAFIADLLEQFFRKVQACRRSRCAAAFVGIDRLVFIGVFHLFVDIRRKRHFTDLVDDVVEIALVGELDDTAAEIGPVFDGTRQAFGKARLSSPAGPSCPA